MPVEQQRLFCEGQHSVLSIIVCQGASFWCKQTLREWEAGRHSCDFTALRYNIQAGDSVGAICFSVRSLLGWSAVTATRATRIGPISGRTSSYMRDLPGPRQVACKQSQVGSFCRMKMIGAAIYGEAGDACCNAALTQVGAYKWAKPDGDAMDVAVKCINLQKARLICDTRTFVISRLPRPGRLLERTGMQYLRISQMT